MSILSFLLKKSSSEEKEQLNGYHASPLHIAAKSGLLPVVQVLLLGGASMDTTNDAGNNPLDIAYLHDFPLVLQLFVHHEYDPAKIPARYVLQALEYGRVSMACTLLGLGVVPDHAELTSCFALAHHNRFHQVTTAMLGYFPQLLQYLLTEKNDLREGDHGEFYSKIVRRILCLDPGQKPTLGQLCAISILGTLATADYHRIVKEQDKLSLPEQPQVFSKYVGELWLQTQAAGDKAWPPFARGIKYEDFVNIYNLPLQL